MPPRIRWRRIRCRLPIKRSAASALGLGGALLAESLERVDQDRLPAYLESSNPRNIPLYERHGFEVIGEIHFPPVPVITPMRSRPQ